MHSLLGYCKANDVKPREWLTDVFSKIALYNSNYDVDLADLLPHHWKKSNRCQNFPENTHSFRLIPKDSSKTWRILTFKSTFGLERFLLMHYEVDRRFTKLFLPSHLIFDFNTSNAFDLTSIKSICPQASSSIKCDIFDNCPILS